MHTLLASLFNSTPGTVLLDSATSPKIGPVFHANDDCGITFHFDVRGARRGALFEIQTKLPFGTNPELKPPTWRAFATLRVTRDGSITCPGGLSGTAREWRVELKERHDGAYTVSAEVH